MCSWFLKLCLRYVIVTLAVFLNKLLPKFPNSNIILAEKKLGCYNQADSKGEKQADECIAWVLHFSEMYAPVHLANYMLHFSGSAGHKFVAWVYGKWFT